MRTTIDKAGRVVVPKPIRDRLALRGGEEIEIDEVDGVVEIRRPVAEDDLVEVDGLLTFRTGPGLGAPEVRKLIDRDRDERMDRW